MEYTPYYCEENVLRLAEHRDRPDDWVLMISNRARRVALARQHAGRGPGGIVVWDYHVILANRPVEQAGSTLVIDRDSSLEQPVPLCRYLALTFPRTLFRMGFSDEPSFTLVAAADYRARFSSDRSHMLDVDGHYVHQPPPWPATYDEATGNTLFALCDGVDSGVTAVLSLEALRAWDRCEP